MSDKVNQVRTFEVLTATPSRRSPRHWSDDEKARLVAEAFSPAGTVAEVARAYELDVSQLYAWRRKALSRGDGAIDGAIGRTNHDGKRAGEVHAL